MAERVTDKVEQVPYPKSVKFVLVNVFFERFSTGGILAILALFFNRKLGFDQDMSTALFHSYEFLIYFFIIFGTLIAESWLGLYKTLVSMTVIYTLGAIAITVSGIEALNFPLEILAISGLLGTVIGSGGMKSNLNTFGGNQFKLPEQSDQLRYYFSLQYFALKCGSTTSRILYPILREDVKCFEMTDCYPLAFSLSAVAMFISFWAWIFGRKTFKEESANGNMFLKVIGCVTTAFYRKIASPKTDSRSHWLDYASEKFGIRVVSETKAVLNILVLYLPIPLFWALHAQQSSRWVFQATKLDGDIGFYTVKPDQMIVLNSFLGVVSIPIFEQFFYPLIAKCGLKTSLQKITLGGIFAAVSFIFAALVELETEKRTLNIMWMFPQYLIMAMAEVLIYTANLNFSYTEAPASMKSVMMCCMYLTVAAGSLIVVLISGVAFFQSQVYEFLFFSGIMFIDIFIFAILASRYKYREKTEDETAS